MENEDHVTLEVLTYKTRYELETASIWYDKGSFAINIEGEEDEDFDVDYDDEDDPFYFTGPPHINAHWESIELPLKELVGTTIQIPKAFNEKLQTHVSTLYLSAHYDLDNLEIKFLNATEESVTIQLTGNTDPAETDESIRVLALATLHMDRTA